ncbi:MAG: helix-turn-helix transcriptional regulator [Lachnospiraceae bacterium]
MPRNNLKEARQKSGMTQQEMADKLNVGLRHYQKIEAGDTNGSFEVWDALEDILKIHQRKLREISGNCHVPEENLQVHLKNLPK